MTYATVRVDGLRALVRDLEAAGAGVDDLKDVFSGIAAEGAQVAEGYTPARTGRLRGTVRGNRAKNKAVIMWGRGKIKYAGPILYGWPARNITASRTISRTDADMGDRAVELLDKGLDDLLDKTGLTP